MSKWLHTANDGKFIFNGFWYDIARAMSVLLISIFVLILIMSLLIPSVNAVSIQEIKDSQNVIQEGKAGGQTLNGSSNGIGGLVLNKNGGFVGINTTPVYKLDIVGSTNFDDATIAVTGNDIFPSLYFIRNSSIPDNTKIMDIRSYGFDGKKYINMIEIRGVADGDTSVGNNPSKLIFSTTPYGENITSDRVWLDRDGNFGIGRASTGGVLNIYSDYTRHIKLERDGNNDAAIGISSVNTLLFADWDTFANLFSFDLSNGYIGIGLSKGTSQLDTTGSVRFRNCSGTPTFSALGELTCASDDKLKKDKHNYTNENPLPLPKQFKFNDASGYDTNREWTGWSANEVEQTYPECVISRPDMRYETKCIGENKNRECNTVGIPTGTYTKSLDNTCLLAAAYNKINSLEFRLNNICNKHQGWCDS